MDNVKVENSSSNIFEIVNRLRNTIDKLNKSIEFARKYQAMYQSFSPIIKSSQIIENLYRSQISNYENFLEGVEELANITEQEQEQENVEISYKDILEKVEKVVNSLDNIIKVKEDFSSLILEFKTNVEAYYWEHFWEINNEGKQLRHNPEKIAQDSLSLFLQGVYYPFGVVIRELKVGEGYIDIEAFLLGKKTVLELKVIGDKHSSINTEKGYEQLAYYLNRENLTEGYLIIFDGRKTNRGRQFEDRIVKGKKIYTIVININPDKAPTKKGH